MKILLISSTNDIKCGIGNLTHELCMFLKGKVDFTLLLPAGEKKYEYATYSIDYVLPPYIFNTKTPKFLKYLLFRYKTDADMIHSVFEFPFAVIADRIARQNKIPLLIGLAGTYAVKPLFSFPDSFFMKRAYNNSKYLTAISQFTVNAVKKYSGTKTPINIIHCPVNFERFSRAYNTEDLKEKYKGKRILITVGALKPRKGQNIVLEALALLKKERNDFHYIIIGNNEKRSAYMHSLHQIINDNDLAENVTFADAVSDSELPRYFSLTDIYIHTPIMSNWNFEGFGIVYLEAGAAGKPVIASNSGGTTDAVVDNKTGIIVKEGDVHQTYSAIKMILNDHNLAKSLGAGGFQYAKEHTWEEIGPKFIDLYRQVLANK